MILGKSTSTLSNACGDNINSILYLNIMSNRNLKEQRLLRKYIKESLVTELGFTDVALDVGRNFGTHASDWGPSSWFANFMSRQMDKLGDSADEWIGTKLDAVLPGALKNRVEQYSQELTGESSSTVLSKVVAGWIEEVEDLIRERFPSSEKRQIYRFAADEYAQILRRNPDVKKAIEQVKRKLDIKYGARISRPAKSKEHFR